MRSKGANKYVERIPESFRIRESQTKISHIARIFLQAMNTITFLHTDCIAPHLFATSDTRKILNKNSCLLKSVVELWGKLVLHKAKANKTITTIIKTIFVLLGVTPNDRHYVPLYLKQVSSSCCHRKCQQVKKIFEHVTNSRIMMMKRFGRKMEKYE